MYIWRSRRRWRWLVRKYIYAQKAAKEIHIQSWKSQWTAAPRLFFSRSPHTNVLWSLRSMCECWTKIIKYVLLVLMRSKYEEMILEARKKVMRRDFSVQLSNTSRSKEIADELMILFSYKSHWHTFQLLYYNRKI